MKALILLALLLFPAVAWSEDSAEIAKLRQELQQESRRAQLAERCIRALILKKEAEFEGVPLPDELKEAEQICRDTQSWPSIN